MNSRNSVSPRNIKSRTRDFANTKFRKATSNLIWLMVLRSAFTLFVIARFSFAVFSVGLYQIHILKSIQKRYSPNSTAFERRRKKYLNTFKFRINEDELKLEWHAFFEKKNTRTNHRICIALALPGTTDCREGLNFSSRHSVFFPQMHFLCVFVCLFGCWLESSRSLTIWFIATYICRFDCVRLCRTKFADTILYIMCMHRIQSNCSVRSTSHSVSQAFSLDRSSLNICFAHTNSLLLRLSQGSAKWPNLENHEKNTTLHWTASFPFWLSTDFSSHCECTIRS